MLRLAMLIALLWAGAALAGPRGRLGLIVDEELHPSQIAVRNWAEDHYSLTVVRPDGEGGFLGEDGRVVALSDLSCLWYHCVKGNPRELSPRHCKLATEASLRAMADYLASGGEGTATPWGGTAHRATAHWAHRGPGPVSEVPWEPASWTPSSRTRLSARAQD